MLPEVKIPALSVVVPILNFVVDKDVVIVQLDTLLQLPLHILDGLVPDCHSAVVGDVPLAADDDLVGDLDEEGGDADGVVEVGGDVEDHLDGVEEAHDRGPHLPRVFQIDCVDILLRCPEEFGIVDCLGQKKRTIIFSN